MRYLLTLICAITISVSALAEEFFLTDAAGKKHGPYEYGDGKVLNLEGRFLELTIVDRKAHAVIEKMKSIVIPEMEFRAANINDVFQFLQDQSVQFDQTPGHPRGVSNVLSLGPAPEESVDPQADPFAASAPRQASGSDVPLITFAARDLTIYEAMNIVCELADLRWTARNGVVMVDRKPAEAAKKASPRKVERPALRARPPASTRANAAHTKILMKNYTVVEGDDLFAIAMMWGVSVSRLREVNSMTSRDKLKVGQKIMIPLTE